MITEAQGAEIIALLTTQNALLGDLWWWLSWTFGLLCVFAGWAVFDEFHLGTKINLGAGRPSWENKE